MFNKKHLFFDGEKYQVVVDLEDEQEVGDDEQLASDALVFMLVAVNTEQFLEGSTWLLYYKWIKQCRQVFLNLKTFINL